jgi:hypothetical protein
MQVLTLPALIAQQIILAVHSAQRKVPHLHVMVLDSTVLQAPIIVRKSLSAGNEVLVL